MLSKKASHSPHPRIFQLRVSQSGLDITFSWIQRTPWLVAFLSSSGGFGCHPGYKYPYSPISFDIVHLRAISYHGKNLSWGCPEEPLCLGPCSTSSKMQNRFHYDPGMLETSDPSPNPIRRGEFSAMRQHSARLSALIWRRFPAPAGGIQMHDGAEIMQKWGTKT